MPDDFPQVSAMLPVHAGVAAADLSASVGSLLSQTRLPDEIVVVEDGPLTVEQRALLDEFGKQHPRFVRVVLAENQGAGIANQIGLETARGEWIAKADADDISLDRRIEMQLLAVAEHGVDLCGAAMLELSDRSVANQSLRSMPQRHAQIGARLRWNNPVNHPTAFYRRSVALEAGGYPPWRYMQDYGLMARMYAAGAHMMNLEDALVLFRASRDVAKRRRSATIRRLEWQLQQELHRLGILNRSQLFINLAWRTAFRLLPFFAVRAISRRVLARPVIETPRRK